MRTPQACFGRCTAKHCGTGMIERWARSVMTLVHFPSMAVRPSGLMIACSRVKLRRR